MFGICKKKSKTYPQIDIITKWDKKDDKFYAPGALIRVKNGKSLLGIKFSEEPGYATYYTLMFKDKPLFQFQGDEYYCPTCEKMVRSGYQLEQTEEFHIEKLNRENVPFSEVLDEMAPILGLLKDNYYVVLDTELYPTDGNGHLFWNVPNSDEPVPGSCLYYRGNGELGLPRPHFTVATQSIKKLCESRVDYYRRHQNCRAIAYYMDGYMTSLIDGHHKAMAAAVEHKKVNALVIMPCYLHKCKQSDGKFRSYVSAGDMSFACDEYSLKENTLHVDKRLSLMETRRIQKLIPKKSFEFPYDNEALASYYPNVEQMAAIDAVGDITDERINDIISEKYICELDEISTLMKALGGLKHERILEVADYFLRQCTYISFFSLYAPDTVMVIIGEILKMPRTDELEKYLIDIMIEYEDEYPSVGKMIIEYL